MHHARVRCAVSAPPPPPPPPHRSASSNTTAHALRFRYSHGWKTARRRIRKFRSMRRTPSSRPFFKKTTPRPISGCFMGVTVRERGHGAGERGGGNTPPPVLFDPAVPLASPGSGIQPDCRGDVLWLEHFYTKAGQGIGSALSVVPKGSCKNGDHAPCPFKHPGNPPVEFPYYMCGRWNAGDVNTESQGNLQKARWLAGVAGLDAWTYALKRCVGCPSADGLLTNPYAHEKDTPDKLIVGNLQPWVCTNHENDDYKVFSAVPGEPATYKCYSDDEVRVVCGVCVCVGGDG